MRFPLAEDREDSGEDDEKDERYRPHGKGAEEPLLEGLEIVGPDREVVMHEAGEGG